jgi:fructose-bisphosphate aldolase class II
LDRVRKIQSTVDVPLVMHGGSGLAESDYPRIIESGITKVCYYTAMGIGASDDLGRMLADATPGTVAYHNIISRGIDYFYMATKKLLDVLGSSGAVE